MKRSLFYLFVLVILLGLQEAVAQSGDYELTYESMVAELISEEMDGFLEPSDSGEFQGIIVHIEDFHSRNSVVRTVNKIVRSYSDVEYIQRMKLSESGETISGIIAVIPEEEEPVLIYVGYNEDIGGVAVVDTRRRKE